MGPKIKAFLLYTRIVLDMVIDFFFSLYWDQNKKYVPTLNKKHAILAESATELARRIRQKELKSEELVQAVIERIKEVDPIINAVAVDRYDDALTEAKEVDALIAAGLSEEEAAKKPFLGVPFTSKECQAVKGLPLTMGLWCRRKEKATEDSEAIRRMKEAGAIVLAATNLPELLIWQETRNPVYGMTLNPHHTGRSPGGSSGAEASLMASYGTAISLCSDVGGSTRMPAFYCGMFGHHPTPGVINNKGVFFRDGTEKDSMLSLGFISKHVEDLAPLTKVIAGDKAHLLQLDREIDLKYVKFHYMESSEDPMISSIRPDLKKAMRKVIKKLSEGAVSTDGPVPYKHDGFDYCYRLWSYWLAKEPGNYAKYFTNTDDEANGIVELIKKIFGMSMHYFFTIVFLLELQYMPKVNAEWAEKITKEMKDDLFSKLGDNGVLLMPSAPHTAPYHYSCLLRPYNFAYFAIVNALKCPATQVPLGVDSNNLPVGIQVVASPHNDALCLAVAKYLEKEFGGAVMACTK